MSQIAKTDLNRHFNITKTNKLKNISQKILRRCVQLRDVQPTTKNI